MRISPAGIELIKRFEQLELSAYQDIAGVWTIGYGHTEGFLTDPPTLFSETVISEDQAEQLLRLDLSSRVSALDGWRIAHGVDLNQHQFDALVSLIFNIGIGQFRRSTVVKRLLRKDVIGAADAIGWFNKAHVNGVLREVKGLTRRRAAERELFLRPKTEPDAKSNTARITPQGENRLFWNRARSRCQY